MTGERDRQPSLVATLVWVLRAFFDALTRTGSDIPRDDSPFSARHRDVVWDESGYRRVRARGRDRLLGLAALTLGLLLLLAVGALIVLVLFVVVFSHLPS
jgi:hypothetical protein